MRTNYWNIGKLDITQLKVSLLRIITYDLQIVIEAKVVVDCYNPEFIERSGSVKSTLQNISMSFRAKPGAPNISCQRVEPLRGNIFRDARTRFYKT